METEKVSPELIAVGDRIRLWTNIVADDPNGPRHYEVRTVRRVEEPDSTHSDRYDFELETPGTDPLKFLAVVSIDVDDQVERVVSPLPISEPWVQHGP
ncbi:hypothetical protein [Rhodococcus sp. 06-1460-1B]|uniref:hypothetical protein n=1 Tax=Rhodococcus sp. 06-1460-1B TaxID=2022501 RepID=UPI000B9C623E|nr:hypothetical protein [Rhodococcus sp. 06-1460-1B]OZD63111.1 hypothetical protein CH268_09205 [Rhodococcus sp. 06-1460-1B]